MFLGSFVFTLILNDFNEVDSYVIEISHNNIGTDEILIKIAVKENSEKLLQNINDLFSYDGSTLRFVYLAKNNEVLDKEQLWNKETIHDYFINKTHSFHSEVNKNLELSIQKAIDQFGIDLIIMAAKNLNLFEQILFRPKMVSIKYYSKTPFLILH